MQMQNKNSPPLGATSYFALTLNGDTSTVAPILQDSLLQTDQA